MGKKILALLLSTVLVLGLFPSTATLAVSTETATYTVVADKTDVVPGDTVSFSVQIELIKPMTSFEATISLPDGLTLVEGSQQAIDSDTIGFDKVNNNEAYLLFSGYGEPYTATEAVVLATFQCTVDTDAAPGEYTVTLIDTWLDNDDYDYEEHDIIPVTINVTAGCGHDDGNTQLKDAVAATETTPGYTGDLWCLTCETMISQGEVIPAISEQVAVNLTTGKAYTDLQTAITEAKDTNAIVQVRKQVTQESVSAESGVILDLNGYTVGTLTAAEGTKLQIIDTANDNYGETYGTVTVAEGVTVETVTQADGKCYVAISSSSNQYSAHRVEAKINAKVLRYTLGLNGAAGFRASFTADAAVAAVINSSQDAAATGWGWSVGISTAEVTDGASADIVWAEDQLMGENIKTFAAGENTRFIIYKDILEGTDPTGNAQAKLWAKPYVVVDGVKVEGAAVSASLQELVNAANGTASSDEQKVGIKAMLQSCVDAGTVTHGQDGWTIDNIMAAS